MEEKDIVEEVKKEVEEIKMCKFTHLKEGGLIIKLEGYPINFIKIIRNDRRNRFSVTFRDMDGWLYKVDKEVEGDLIGASINRVIEEVRHT